MAYGSESSDDCELKRKKLLSGEPTEHKKPREIDKKEKKNYQCDFEGCTSRFSRPWRLAAHQAVHKGEKLYCCVVDNCDKSYTTSSHLRRHIKNAHATKDKSNGTIKCDYQGCKATFNFPQNLKRHYKRTHELKTCITCGKNFAKQSLLKAHEFHHTGVPKYTCSTCDIGFIRLSEYNKHLRAHRINICTIPGCYESFDTWSKYRKHIGSHPKNFTCFYCKKKYRQKIFLEKHIVTRHIDGVTRNQTPLKRYDCHSCDASFLGKASLKRHIYTIHNKPADEPEVIIKCVTPRARRKDINMSKKHIALTLSGVCVVGDLNNKLLSGQQLTPNDLNEEIIKERIYETEVRLIEGSCSETDASIVSKD